MLRRNIIVYLYLIVIFSMAIVATFYLTESWTENHGFAAVVSIIVLSNLLLLTALTRVWLLDRMPRLKLTLDKLPGLSVGVPVPEKLRVAKQVERQKPKVNRVNIASNAVSSFVSNDRSNFDDHKQPFTLGTLAFEPPEPIGKAAQQDPVVPVLDAIVLSQPSARGVEGAFHKSKRHLEIAPQQRLLARFHEVCRSLKRINQEVAVWTEGELSTLANSMLMIDSDTKDMVAILLPQRVVRINSQRTFEFEHHATVLNNVILATGEQVDVNFINSSKDETSGQCVVNFEHKGKPVSWRFIENGNSLSNKFLNTALNWVAKQACGQFHLLADDDYKKSFVFVSEQVERELSQSEVHSLR